MRSQTVNWLIAVALFLSNYGCAKSPENKLIGEWKGTDASGETVSAIFNRDHTFGIMFGEKIIGSLDPGGNECAQ